MNEDSRNKLNNLVAARRPVERINPRYSRFIRRMRLALPLAALGLVAIVFTWSGPRENYIAHEQVQKPKPGQMVVGKNELLNPRFENTDEKNQPYTLTAKRAVQDEKDDKLVLLEEPKGDMQMENGHWIALEAKEGAFQQDEKHLLLQGGVHLFHDGGYQMDTASLRIDMAENKALSDTDVFVQGPEGTLAATGLEGDGKKGTLVFIGPVKVVLNADTLQGGGLLR